MLSDGTDVADITLNLMAFLKSRGAVVLKSNQKSLNVSLNRLKKIRIMKENFFYLSLNIPMNLLLRFLSA